MKPRRSEKCLTDAAVKAGDENTWSPGPTRAQPIAELTPALFPNAWKWLSEQLDRCVWSHQLSLAPQRSSASLTPDARPGIRLAGSHLRCISIICVVCYYLQLVTIKGETFGGHLSIGKYFIQMETSQTPQPCNQQQRKKSNA